MKRKLFIIIFLHALLLSWSAAQDTTQGAAASEVQSGQADTEVAAYVKMLEQGRADQVKSDLSSLITKYQNHPGVMYLQARLANDGVEAMKMYQGILDNFPQSEWADDALYYTYQYYYSLGLYRTADLKLQQLKKNYPNSPYVKGKTASKPLPPDEAVPKVTSTTPSPAPEKPLAPQSEGTMEADAAQGAYAIQVGAFSTLSNAEKLKSFFEDLNYPVEIQNKVRGGRSLFLVWVGSFNTAEEAKKFGTEVKSKHQIESIVVMR